MTIMNKEDNKSNLRMVHFAVDAPKHITSTIELRADKKILDPSSCLRVNRYPVPGSFSYRTILQEKGA